MLLKNIIGSTVCPIIKVKKQFSEFKRRKLSDDIVESMVLTKSQVYYRPYQ